MIDEKIIRLIQSKETKILDADKALLEGLTPLEISMFDAVKKQISKMNQSDGTISFDEKNVSLINEIDKIIVDTIQNSNYPSDVNKYLQNFDSVQDWNERIHEGLNEIDPKEFAAAVDPFKKETVKNTLEGLTGSGVSTTFIEPLRQELFKNIVAGTNSVDVEAALRLFIQGNQEKAGQFKRYVTQISRDALNQYDGLINSRIAEDFGLDAFQYVGSLIEDSRKQCIRWTGKEVILKKDLEKEISWAFNNGEGMIPGTNSNNFAVFRGGYNCRHSAIPFKLTKREAARLKAEEEKPVPLPEKVLKDKKIVKESIQDNPQKAILQPLADKELVLTYGETDLIPETLRNRTDISVPDQVFMLSDNGTAKVINKDASCYKPGSKVVDLGLESSRYVNSPIAKSGVIIHEFGHRTHFEQRNITMFEVSPEYNSAFEESQKLVKQRLKEDEHFKRFNQTLWPKIRDYQEEYKDIFTKKDIIEFAGSYADTMQALTNSKIGSGHEKKYMNNFYLRRMEWFAHASENYFQGNIFFEKEFPDLFNQMNKFYSNEVIKKSKLKLK